MSEENFLKIAELLTQLAVLKGVVKGEKEIAAMSKFLMRDFSHADIQRACGYFAKRFERFPDVAAFYNLICPIIEDDTRAEKVVGQILSMVQSGYDKEKVTDEFRIIFDVYSWSQIKEMSHSEMNFARPKMVKILKEHYKGIDAKLEYSENSVIEYKKTKGVLNGIEKNLLN